MNDLEHPDITKTLKTGYPSWNQPKKIYCCECGTHLDDDEIYEDSCHPYLCKECLLFFHKKE